MIFAFKNLRRRQIRTLLCILGVGVGVSTIVMFTLIADGFKESINEYARQGGIDLLVYDRSVFDPAWSRVTQEEMEILKQVPNVEHVAATSAMPARIDQGKLGLLVLGRYPDEQLMEHYKMRLVEGRALRNEKEAMLGITKAQELKKSVGDTMSVLNEEFTIVGIYRTNVSFENGGMVVHMEVVRRKLHPRHVGMAFFVYVKDPALLAQTAEEIQKRYPRFRAVQTREVVQQFDQAVYIDYFVLLISVAALLAGAIVVLIVLLMSISERVREIGTLRAFGWSRIRIMRMIWMEGLILSVLGGLAGIALGTGGAEGLMLIIPPGFIETNYSWLTFVKGFAIALGVGMVGALIPAYMASRLAPVEALRYE